MKKEIKDLIFYLLSIFVMFLICLFVLNVVVKNEITRNIFFIAIIIMFIFFIKNEVKEIINYWKK